MATGRVRRLTRAALLCACGCALSALESLLPPFIPLPGVRLGLANAATLVALTQGLPAALCVALFKAWTALLMRGGAAGAMSLCGGVLAAAAMWLTRRLAGERVSGIGVGVVGAAAHNVGQLAVAAGLFSPAVAVAYAPPTLAVGVLTGAAIGFVGTLLTRRLHSILM